MTGAVNVMDSFEGWKPVSTEAIIQAKPDFILISERGLNSFGSIEKLGQHPSLVFTPAAKNNNICLLYTSPSPRDREKSRMPSSA